MVLHHAHNSEACYQFVNDTNGLLVLGFFERKCALCRKSLERFLSVSDEYPSAKCVTTYAVDSLEACRKWNVRKAPTFTFFTFHKEERDHRVEGGDLDKVEQAIKELLRKEVEMGQHTHEIDLEQPQVKNEEHQNSEAVSFTSEQTSQGASQSEGETVSGAIQNLQICEVQDQAFVTLTTSDEYVLGALVLAHSLRRTGTSRRLVCMTTKNVPSELRALLDGAFDQVVDVDVFDSSDEANLKLLGRPELGCTFTKLHCWRLTEYSKCIFLDADMLVLSNIDELFDREELTACRDAGWPDYFNSGLYVYKPSVDTYKQLVELATTKGSFDGGDQGLLNRFFGDWGFADMRRHLPFTFNCTVVYLNATYTYLPALVENLAKVRVLHFAGAVNKPWRFRFDAHRDDIVVPGSDTYAVFARYWWHLYAAHLHQSLVHAIQRAEHSAAHIDELVRRVAATPFHEHSMLVAGGAQLHPHVALFASALPRFDAPQSFVAPQTCAAPQAAAAPTPAPAAHVAQPSAPQSYQPPQQGIVGPRTFADIERKLRENL